MPARALLVAHGHRHCDPRHAAPRLPSGDHRAVTPEKKPNSTIFMSTISSSPTINELINAAMELLRLEKDRSIPRRVETHIHVVTGCNRDLPQLKSDTSVPDAVKRQCCETLILALGKRDWSLLKTDAPVIPGKRIDPLQVLEQSDKETPSKPSRRFDPVAPPKIEGDDMAAVIARGVWRHIAPLLPSASVDEEAVKKIAAAHFDHAINNGGFPEDRVKGILEQWAKEHGGQLGGSRIVIEAAGETRTVSGASHWQLPQIITWLNADVPVWLWGAAGGGKTHMVRQVAEALALPYFTLSIDPTMTIGKILGYRNLANGEFVEGWLYQPYKNGGVAMLDEIDTGDPGILAALNALLANDEYTFPNGERVKRHDKFRVIAGANTKGVGAVAGYTARNRLDAATLDRFAVIELTYDEALELHLATGLPAKQTKSWVRGVTATAEQCSKWVAWVQRVRQTVGVSVLISPRASYLGSKALRAGVQPNEVAECCVFKLCTSDTRQQILNRCGEFAI